jgi:hypothetical protein
MGQVTVPDNAAVDAFWRWWSGQYREVLAEAVEGQRVGEVIEPLLARLHKVHPRTWAAICGWEWPARARSRGSRW